MMVKELEEVVVRFSGDSGDGMQLAGNIFSNMSATVGNDICTFPDYPADIRSARFVDRCFRFSGSHWCRTGLHSRRPLSRISSDDPSALKNTNQIL